MKRTPPGKTRKQAQPEPTPQPEQPAPEPAPAPEPVAPPEPAPPPAEPPAPREIEHGLYHYSWAPPEGEREARQLTDLERVHELGFTLMHASHLQDVAHARTFLNRAAELKIGVILEDVPLGQRQELADHDALLAFSVMDDANAKDKTPAMLTKATDPEHAHGKPRYISIGIRPGVDDSRFYGPAEMVGVQIYPFPDEPLSAYWPAMLQARRWADENRVELVANLQIHNDAHRGWPTPEQVRALGLAAAAVGFDRVLWYTLLDNTEEARQVPPDELLQAASAVARETRQRLPARVEGDRLYAGQRLVDLERSEVIG